MNHEQSNSIAALLAEGLIQLSSMTAPVIEAAAGYRQQCEEAGFSPEIAGQMAADFHRYAIELMSRYIK